MTNENGNGEAKPMRRCPMTGDMIPAYIPRKVTDNVTSVVDLVDPKPLAPKAKKKAAKTTEELLAAIRQKYAALDTGKRMGATGEKMMKDYRRLSLEYLHLKGENAPPIHADM